MPTAVEVKACAPGPLVADSKQHGQPVEVVGSISGIAKEYDFEDIPPYKHPLITLSLQYFGVPFPCLYPIICLSFPLFWGQCLEHWYLVKGLSVCRRLTSILSCLLLHSYLLLLLSSIPSVLLHALLCLNNPSFSSPSP